MRALLGHLDLDTRHASVVHDYGDVIWVCEPLSPGSSSQVRMTKRTLEHCR